MRALCAALCRYIHSSGKVLELCFREYFSSVNRINAGVHSGIGYLPPVEFEAILSDEKRRKQLGQINLKISGKSPV
jgi:hypothetical protein